jgi:Protein of unknown function (DUF2975)
MERAYRPSSQTGIALFLVNLALVVGAAAFVVTFVGTVVALVQGGGKVPLGGDALTVKAQLVRTDLMSLPQGLVLTDNPEVSVDVRDPSRTQVLLQALTWLGPAIIAGLVLWFLRGLLRSADDGDPFGPENVTRLRRIGLVLAFGAPIVVAVNQTLNRHLFDALPSDVKAHLTLPGFSIPWAPIVAGIGAFILAAVFEYGVRLREDVEATV